MRNITLKNQPSNVKISLRVRVTTHEHYYHQHRIEIGISLSNGSCGGGFLSCITKSGRIEGLYLHNFEEFPFLVMKENRKILSEHYEEMKKEANSLLEKIEQI
ncbi:MAG: hypothetical protein WC120_00335 [Parcubacteria group bacterium]